MICIKGHTLHASVDYCGCNDCRDFTPDATTGCANLQQPPACPEATLKVGDVVNTSIGKGIVISAGQEQKHCTKPEQDCAHKAHLGFPNRLCFAWGYRKECPYLQPVEQPTPETPLIEELKLNDILNDYYILGAKAQRDADMALIPAIRAEERREFAEKICNIPNSPPHDGLADSPDKEVARMGRFKDSCWKAGWAACIAHIRAMAEKE